MSRRGIALGAVAVLLSGLAACGIPGESDVRIDGRGPVADTAPADHPAAQPPGRTTSGSDPEAFAKNFLTAAAGEPGEAYERVNEYIEDSKQFKPKADDKGDINVVRVDVDGGGIEVTQNKDGTSLVTVEVQQIGVLRANGSIGEPVQQKTEYSFVVGAAPTDPGTGGGLWVLQPPEVLLMTDDALRDYYQEHTIYFWNANGTSLVPDLRYLPRTVPVQRHATEVLEWLTGGPSEWLKSAVALPEGTSPVGNVPAPEEGGRLEINLAVKAGALETKLELEKLFTQIVWSLRNNQLLDNELELKIQNQSRMIEVAADYRRDHPLYQLTGAAARYGVFAGRIYPLTNPGEPRPVPIPAAENHDIVTAGVSRNGDDVAVALVVRDGESFRLRTGTGPGVATSLLTSEEKYDDLSRPVWLKEAGIGGPVGLVVAQGKLYTFTAGNPRLTRVSFSGTDLGATAVAASMDGNRIAFVSGGRLYVAGVRPVDGGLNVEPARQVATSLHSLSAVDWFGENLLLVAGVDSEDAKAINRINVDGAVESGQIRYVSAAPVEALAADPTSLEAPPLPPTYEANEVAFVSDTIITRSQIAPGAGEPPPNVNSATASFYLY
ncbi:LpqB family beta-propeller domain-containing protein [Plantactinospora sp. ZYX-F-223]|uniref:LpqB family beta-propeller domain-containing protein n=1 Tax=Plantactinospora sp. ZYX-F-223 TaxID=3144103 RepID=UPI0031FBE51D